MAIGIDCIYKRSTRIYQWGYQIARTERLNKTLLEDIKNMEQIMDRTALRADIWQDRYIYWIAVAIYHILLHLRKLEK